MPPSAMARSSYENPRMRAGATLFRLKLPADATCHDAYRATSYATFQAFPVQQQVCAL